MKTRPGVWQAAKKPPRQAAVWCIGIFGGPALNDLNPVSEAGMPVRGYIRPCRLNNGGMLNA
jgi:hypothetical protein